MLSIREIRDNFVTEYKLLCTIRNVNEISIGDKVLASWIASGQQEICDRLKVIMKPYDLYYDAMNEFFTYGLPDDWGGLIGTDPQMEFDNAMNLPTIAQPGYTLEKGDVRKITIYNDGNGYRVILSPLPISSGIIRFWYTVNPLHYSPSAGSSQDWGSFDGSTFSGSLPLPDKYKDLLVLFMLGKCFGDKKQEFEFRLESFKGNSASKGKDEIKYTPIGGY